MNAQRFQCGHFFLEVLKCHLLPPSLSPRPTHTLTHSQVHLPSEESCFKESKQNECVIKFIRVSIQTFLGGQDDMRVSLQGARENHTGKDGRAGVGLAVAQFQTNVKTRALHQGET